MLRYPILWVFAMVAGGVGVGELVHLPAWGWGGLALAAVAGTGWAWVRGRGVALAALGTLGLTAAMSAQSWEAPAPFSETCEAQRWRGVLDEPQQRAVNPVTGEVRRRVVLRELRELCEDTWVYRGGRVRLSVADGRPLARGDEIELHMRYEPPAPARNPVGPDPLRSARRERLSGRGVGRSQPVLVSAGGGVGAWIDRGRAVTAQRLEAALPLERAAVAKALALGDRASIAPAQRDRWSRAGVAHLLAISGLHVGLIAWLLFLFFARGLAWLPGLVERVSARRGAAAATIPLLITFCVWVGAPTSAVRATVMAVAVLLGIALGRRGNAANALGIAGAGILLLDPTSLYDAGFLLSFAAVGALLCLPNFGARRWARWLLGPVVASVAATLATAPISASTFGQVSVIAPFTNLIAVPIGTLVTVPLVLLFTIVGAIVPLAEAPLAAALEASLWVLEQLAAFAADLPGASVGVVSPTRLEIVAYALALVGVLGLVRRWRAHLLVGVGCGLLLISVAGRVLGNGSSGELRVLHPYVGQGDAAVVLFPRGSVMLFDGGGAIDPGGWDPGYGVIAPLLRQLGVSEIDVMVVSHPDPDHLRGLLYVAERFDVRQLWWNGAGENGPAMRQLLREVQSRGGRALTAEHVPPRSDIDGVTVRWLQPRPEPGQAEGLPYYPELSDNDNSIVLHLQLGERTTLLPGDVEIAAEDRLVERMPIAEIFKAPHHGSGTSSSAGFLQGVGARAVVISCGHRNRFGFPNEEVLKRYASHDLLVFRTDQDGLVELRTSGDFWKLTTQRGRTAVIR